MRRVVVTGANRGLGLELSRQLLAAGDEVVATARQPKTADDLNKLPDESVRGILNVVDALTPAQSGAFLDHTGATLPW
jgi:NAD(P)-dependent dehydrogenase (short-subunit alcohol dehydrogenase family)